MKAEHDAWAERQKVRAEKIAKGEEVGPEEPDPTAEPEVGCLGLLKFLFYTLIVLVLAGKFLTGSYLWEHELPNFKTLIPVRVTLSAQMLMDPLMPLFVDQPTVVLRTAPDGVRWHCRGASHISCRKHIPPVDMHESGRV